MVLYINVLLINHWEEGLLLIKGWLFCCLVYIYPIMCIYTEYPITVIILFIYQISNMKARGLEFLTIPDSYYDQLREKLKSAKITVAEDLNTVSSLWSGLFKILFFSLWPHSRSISSFSMHVLGLGSENETLLCYSQVYLYTVEPPNKGHFGDNINSAVLSLIERLSSSWRFSMNRNYWEW